MKLHWQLIVLAGTLIISSYNSSTHIRENKMPNEKRVISIEMNGQSDSVLDLPISCQLKRLQFCIADGQEIYEEGDPGQFFILSLSNDTLSMRLSGEPYTGGGKFILLPKPEMVYVIHFDPVTYEETVSPSYYYTPVKIGKWVIQSAGKTFEKTYQSKFQSEPLDYICRD